MFQFRISTCFLFLFPLLSLTACNTPIEPPGFHGLVVNSIEPDLTQQTLTLDLGLRFRYINPFPSRIPVLPHQFKLFLGNFPTPIITTSMPGFLLDPGSTDKIYPIRFIIAANTINNIPVGNILDQPEIPYKFVTSFRLTLPNGNTSPSVDLAFADSLRIPRLPVVAIDGSPNVRLLGDLKTIDISGVFSSFVGVGNIAANQIPPAQHTGDAVNDAAADASYAAAVGAATALSAAANLLNAHAYADFQQAWDKLKSSQKILDLGNSHLTGAILAIPLKITNPNPYPIKGPVASGSIINTENNARRTISALGLTYDQPNTNGLTPGENHARLLLELHWDNLPATSQDPLLLLTRLTGSGTIANLEFNAELTLDLGYGPVKIPLTQTLNLKLGQ